MLLRSNLKRYGGAGSNDNFTNTMADPWIPMISANFLGNHESVCASLKCKKCTTVKPRCHRPYPATNGRPRISTVTQK